MGGCRCSYKSCRSATKTTENLHFFHYPVKHRDRCAVWIKNADKPEFAHLPDYQLRNKVICGLHFEDRYFANLEKRRLVHNAIPTLDAGCDSASDDLSYVKEVEILPSSHDGSTFTLSLDDLQPGSAKKQKLEYNGSINLPDVPKVEPDVYTIDPSYFNQTFFNSTDIKEVVINSASVLEANHNDNDDHLDDEDCMIDDTRSNYSHSQTKPSLYSTPSEKPIRSLLYEDDLDHPEQVEIEDSKANLMLSNISNSLQASKMPTLKAANGATTTIKKIKLALNQSLQPVSSPQVKRSVLKKVTTGSAAPSHQINAGTSLGSPVGAANSSTSPLSGNFKQTQQIATNTIRLTNKNLIRCLKGRLPDSILGAVSLHLNKRRNAVTVEEQEYESMMFTIPLQARSALRSFGWCIPTPAK